MVTCYLPLLMLVSRSYLLTDFLVCWQSYYWCSCHKYWPWNRRLTPPQPLYIHAKCSTKGPLSLQQGHNFSSEHFMRFPRLSRHICRHSAVLRSLQRSSQPDPKQLPFSLPSCNRLVSLRAALFKGGWTARTPFSSPGTNRSVLPVSPINAAKLRSILNLSVGCSVSKLKEGFCAWNLRDFLPICQ